jgi:hypothetical protein
VISVLVRFQIRESKMTKKDKAASAKAIFAARKMKKLREKRRRVALGLLAIVLLIAGLCAAIS